MPDSLPDPLDVKRRLLAEAMRNAGRDPDERFIAGMPEQVLDSVLDHYNSPIHVG